MPHVKHEQPHTVTRSERGSSMLHGPEKNAQQSKIYSDLFMQYFIISRFFDELHKRVIVRLFHFLTVEIGLYNIDHLVTYSFLLTTFRIDFELRG